MKKFLFLAALLTVSILSISAQTDPKQINGGVLNGKAVSLPKPEYPESAKAAGLEGTVHVRVLIDETGNVVSAEASSEPEKQLKPCSEDFEYLPVPDAALRESAERAALAAKFSPTLLSGEPVKVSGVITYRFVAGDRLQTASPRPIKGGVMNGKAEYLPAPKYPAAARAVNAQGAVAVQVVIDEAGSITSASAVSGHPLLRAAAVCAATQARFAPTTLEGVPVKVSGVLTYNFVLPSAKAEQ